MNGVITQNDINAVINSVTTNVDASKRILTKITSTISTIVENNKDLDLKIKSLSVIESVVLKYNEIINSVINTICKPLGKDNTNLVTLLGYESKTDPNDSKKKIEKWTVIDAAAQIPNVINSVFKLIESISDFKTGFMQMSLIKKNIKNLKVVLTEVFDMIGDVFGELAVNFDISKVMSYLVSEPDTITEIVKNNTGDKSINGESTSRLDKWDKTETISKTKKGKLGLLDAVEKIFSIVGLLNSLKMPSFAKLKIQLIKMQEQFSWVFDALFNIFGNVAEQKIKIAALENISKIIDNDNSGLIDIFANIKMVFKNIENTKISPVAFISINFGIKWLRSLINKIIELYKDNDTIAVTNKGVNDRIKSVESIIKRLYELFNIPKESLAAMIVFGTFKKIIINSFGTLRSVIALIIKLSRSLNNFPEKIPALEDLGTIIESITNIQHKLAKSALLTVPAIIGALLMQLFLKILPAFVNAVITAISNIESIQKDSVDKFDNLVDIVNAIFSIQKKLVISIILIVPATLALMINIIFVYALSLFITALTFVLKITERISDKGIKSIKNIEALILSILLVCTTILILALIAPFMVKILFKNILPFLLVFALSIGIMVGAIFLASWLSKKAAKESVKLAISMLVVMGALMLASVAIIVAGMIGEKLRDGRMIGNVLIGITGMITIAGIMMGLGLALTFLIPYIAISMTGLTNIAIILGLMVTAGLLIVALGKLTFNFGSYNKKINGYNPKKGVMGEAVGAIGNVGLIVDFVKYLLNSLNFAKDDRKKMRKNKKVLKQVDRVVKEILDIAKRLDKLSTLTIDKEKLLGSDGKSGSINAIFTCIIDIETAMNNFNKDTGTGLTYKTKQKTAKRRARRNKKVLNRVEKVVDKVADIAEELIRIKDFKITTKEWELIQSGITDIFDCVNAVDKQINIFNGAKSINPDTKTMIENMSERKAARRQKREYNKNAKTMSKVESVMEAIAEIIDTLNAIKGFTPDKKISENVESILEAVDTVGGKLKEHQFNVPTIYDVVDLTPMMDYVDSLNEYLKKIGEYDTDKIIKNVENYSKIITQLNETPFDAVKIDSEKMSQMLMQLDNVHRTYNAFNSINVEVVEKSVDSYISMINKLNNVSTDNIKNINTLPNPVSYILTLNDEIIKLFDVDTNTVEQNINNYVKFVDKINSVEVKKLETSAKMFEQMSKFSTSIKGDFDRLADALSEKLLPVLEELKEVMTDIPEKIDQNSQNISASIAATTAPATRTNVAAQVSRENPKMTDAQIQKEADNRMAEKAKADASGIAAKLDELISLLRGHGSENVIVQTI